MFIGRVYENQKKNKQNTNKNTFKEHVSRRQSQSKNRSSDDETDEESGPVKNAKNSANLKKSRYAVNESPTETDKESELEEPVQVPRIEAVEKSFMEKINEKVKKMKKDKDHKEPKTNGFSGESKQVVYSIPSRDVEKGNGKLKQNNAKDKFDSIELDSSDEKYRGSNEVMKSLGIQATPYPPFRLRVLPHPDWQVCFLFYLLLLVERCVYKKSVFLGKFQTKILITIYGDCIGLCFLNWK